MNMDLKEYQVKLIEWKKLLISGNGDDPLWDTAIILKDFCSPWNDNKQSEIIFKALWDRENLFFKFTVLDTVIHLEKRDESHESIASSDRVELFFRPDDSLNPYYCLEIDTAARIMDFIAYPNKDFDFNWNWPKNEIDVKSSVNIDSFTVEGAISILSLQRFNLIKNNEIEAGIFRAKYNPKENFGLEPTWLSWVNPYTETPNFHIDSSFGKLILQK
jgi:hypothetical protein